MSFSDIDFEFACSKRKKLLSSRIPLSQETLALFSQIQTQFENLISSLDMLLVNKTVEQSKYLAALDSLQEAKNKICESVILDTIP